MSQKPPVAPFELDPASLGQARIELVEPEPAPAVPAVPEPPPPRRRPWLRLLIGSGAALVAALLGFEAWQFLDDLFARSVLLGAGFSALFGALAVGALGFLGQELLSLRRLQRVERYREEGRHLMGSGVHGQAAGFLARIEKLYSGRAELADALQRFEQQAAPALDDGERLQLFARTVLQPLDRRAYHLVKAGARDIGALTALSPLGLLDSLIVLLRTLMMLRAIARLYGMRPGAAASWRLLRLSLRNVVAAGLGDLLGDAAVETVGASLLSVLSARAGQGMVNGLLAAKLGLSAMQVCRPLPFTEDEVPSLRQLRAEIFEQATS